ncbi:TPA: tail fiber assembly protein [Escherichia coli]
MYFSKKIGFIPNEWLEDGTYRTLPDDAIELTDTEVAMFHKVQSPPGKEPVVVDGRLVWGDLPPLTAEELNAEAERMRSLLRTTADSEIAWREDALEADIATEDEKVALAAWKKYRVLLMRVDTTRAPDIEWPTPPAVQAR